MCERCQVQEAAKLDDWQTVHDVAAAKLDDHDKKPEAKPSGRHTSKASADKG